MAVFDPVTAERIDDNDRALELAMRRRIFTALGTKEGDPWYGTSVMAFIGDALTEGQLVQLENEVQNAVDDLIDLQSVTAVRRGDAIIVNINGDFDIELF